MKKSKLLVLSDSHGHDEQLVSIILEHPDADAIIFLGDGERDFDTAVLACGIGEDKIICQVRGNCDLASREPDKIIRTLGGIRFLITHGHEQNAKLGIWGLVEEAKRQNCEAVLYGHIHRQSLLEEEGITLINPGSAREGKYCIVEAVGGEVRLLDE